MGLRFKSKRINLEGGGTFCLSCHGTRRCPEPRGTQRTEAPCSADLQATSRYFARPLRGDLDVPIIPLGVRGSPWHVPLPLTFSLTHRCILYRVFGGWFSSRNNALHAQGAGCSSWLLEVPVEAQDWGGPYCSLSQNGEEAGRAAVGLNRLIVNV